MKTGTCVLCERSGLEVTGHHLIPRMRHNKKVKRETTLVERNTKILLCRPCHSQLHALFSEKELERELNTLDKLKAHEDVQKFVAWIRRKRV